MNQAEREALQNTIELAVARGITAGLKPVWQKFDAQEERINSVEQDHNSRLTTLETLQKTSAGWGKIFAISALNLLVGIGIASWSGCGMPPSATASPSHEVMKSAQPVTSNAKTH